MHGLQFKTANAKQIYKRMEMREMWLCPKTYGKQGDLFNL